jgi:hypothetical protein
MKFTWKPMMWQFTDKKANVAIEVERNGKKFEVKVYTEVIAARVTKSWAAVEALVKPYLDNLGGALEIIEWRAQRPDVECVLEASADDGWMVHCCAKAKNKRDYFGLHCKDINAAKTLAEIASEQLKVMAALGQKLDTLEKCRAQ